MSNRYWPSGIYPAGKVRINDGMKEESRDAEAVQSAFGLYLNSNRNNKQTR